MIAKFVALAALIAVAYAQADKYPAGVDPRACPNFPYCDNAYLHTYNTYAPSHYSALPPGIAPAAQYPAGVSPASCPNYPYCNIGAAAVAPLPGFTSRLYPAGVSPAACPNYPLC